MILAPYRGTYWFVTITAYGRDFEPNVPEIDQVIQDFKLHNPQSPFLIGGSQPGDMVHQANKKALWMVR